MTLLNDREIYAAVASAFGDLGRDNCIIGGAVALAESAGETSAVGDNFASGHQPENSPYRWDDGLMQINSVHGFDRQRLVEDPLYNTACGRAVWNRQGWPAWSTFKGGQFRAFLDRMTVAADSFNDTPAPELSPPWSRDDLIALWVYSYGYPGNVAIEPLAPAPDGRRAYSLLLP